MGAEEEEEEEIPLPLSVEKIERAEVSRLVGSVETSPTGDGSATSRRCSFTWLSCVQPVNTSGSSTHASFSVWG